MIPNPMTRPSTGATKMKMPIFEPADDEGFRTGVNQRGSCETPTSAWDELAGSPHHHVQEVPDARDQARRHDRA
jgi:hypothetical protein